MSINSPFLHRMPSANKRVKLIFNPYPFFTRCQTDHRYQRSELKTDFAPRQMQTMTVNWQLSESRSDALWPWEWNDVRFNWPPERCVSLANQSSESTLVLDRSWSKFQWQSYFDWPPKGRHPLFPSPIQPTPLEFF